MSVTNKRALYFLILGDVLILALVTVFGFARHGEISSAGTRMLTTYLPLVVSWFLLAPFLGVYDLNRAAEFRQLWRPFYAMVLVSPFAAFLRALMLGNAPILPVFVVVLGGISSLAILAWRLLFVLLIRGR
jgi:hypothetical protein